MHTRRDLRFRDYVGMVLTVTAAVVVVASICVGGWVLFSAVLNRLPPLLVVYGTVAIGFALIIYDLVRWLARRRRKAADPRRVTTESGSLSHAEEEPEERT